MKNNKGITLTSLIIYIAVIFVVIAALMRVTTYFSNNMQDAADVSFETEFNKLNLYLLDESKTMGNVISVISEDGTQITFTNGNIYLYNVEEKAIYLNGTIKICENVDECVFEQEVADNGKNIVKVTVKINQRMKSTRYVMGISVVLPRQYQQVEYIETTGTQYIDTGFIPSSNTSIEMKVSNTTAANACLYCARSGIVDNTYTAFLLSGVLRVDYYNKQYENISTTTADTTYVYKQQKNLVYVNGELKKTLDESEFSTEYNMYLMASHQGGTNISNMASMKLYYCNIWDGENLVRNFIPCYRKADNVVGIYDSVNEVFYTNQGTGEFSKGKNIVDNRLINSERQEILQEEDYIIGMEPYQQVEYIETTGTQYIDTGFIPSSNTSIEMRVSNTIAANACLYCARSGIVDNTYTAFLLSGVLRVDYYNKQYENISTTTADTTYVYKQQKNLVYVNGELKKTLDESEFSTEYNMYLMASHQGGTNISNMASMKLYYCKIWDGETLVRDMVPFYRISDNVVGMYDKVNDVLYTNAGTGTFTAGPNVN